jgi:hypothetical protein
MPFCQEAGSGLIVRAVAAVVGTRRAARSRAGTSRRRGTDKSLNPAPAEEVRSMLTAEAALGTNPDHQES